MYVKKCPTCGEDIFYKSKDSLTNSIKENSNCRKCMGKVISETRKGIKFSEEHKRKLSEIKKQSKLSDEHKKNIGISLKGLKRSDESKKRYSESKIGDKNPAKQQYVKDKIRNTVNKKYLTDPTYKEKISSSLMKYFKNNPSYISYDELEGYKKYKTGVDRITRFNKKQLIENWNGLDYYDNEDIKNNFNLHYNNVNYPTIDHKFSIIYGFKNKLSIEFIGSIENICFTKRRLNSEKGKNIEENFKNNF